MSTEKDGLPVVPIMACRPNGSAPDEFVVTVICPYTHKPTLYGVDGKVGDEVLKKVPTHRHKRRQRYEGDEEGFWIEGVLTCAKQK